MTAKVAPNIEDPEPIRVRLPGMNSIGCRLTLKEARKFLCELEKSVEAVERYFQCAHEEPNRIFVDRRMERCYRGGSVKIGDQFYCKVHAKKRQGTLCDMPVPGRTA
jgi:hypothetical protein